MLGAVQSRSAIVEVTSSRSHNSKADSFTVHEAVGFAVHHLPLTCQDQVERYCASCRIFLNPRVEQLQLVIETRPA